MKHNKAVVIIPTTGNDCLVDALHSVAQQTIPTDIYLVCDGLEHHSKINKLVLSENFGTIHYLKLPYAVGKNGFYGHRVYAAVPHLVENDYILFLDEDNWYEPNHVESMINTIENYGLDWAYSLRKIVDKEKNFVCEDRCESLGFDKGVSEFLIDTSCYCIRKDVAINSSYMIHSKWGADRKFGNFLKENYKNYKSTGEFTVNYRLGGSPTSPKKEFFLKNNETMKLYYGENYFDGILKSIT